MKERIAHIMRAKNLKASDFANLLGIQPSGVSHILAGRNQPSLDFVKRIKETFPEYNLDWIIFGIGPMTNSEPAKESFLSAQQEIQSNTPPQTKPEPDPTSSVIPLGSPQDPNELPTDARPNPGQDTVFNPAQPLPGPSFPGSDSLNNYSPQVTSVLVFYDDGTFESYSPR